MKELSLGDQFNNFLFDLNTHEDNICIEAEQDTKLGNRWRSFEDWVVFYVYCMEVRQHE